MIDVAKTAGLEKLYRQVYGAMPMEVHSNTFGIEKEEDLDEKRFALLASANSFIECINLIVKNWIVNRKIITVADIYGIPYP